MSTGDLLVVTRDSTTMATIESAMASRGSKAPDACRSVTELMGRLARPGANGHVGIAMVDIDHDPDRTLLDLTKAIAAHPKIRFMVLATDSSEGLILQAMQAGARHFLRKQNISAELDGVLERLLSWQPQAAVRLGDVISVFSCSGGCGATTVAINLANELRLLCGQSVLIIDLDQHYGSVAAHLGISGSYGIAHVLSRGDAIDGHLIQTGAIGFMDGFDVLLSPAIASVDAATPMHWENLGKAIEACREPYRYIVIDAPRLPQHVAADLARISHTVILVCQLNVRDISFAKSTVAFLKGQGMAPDKILPVANRVNRRGPLLKPREGRDAIGMHAMYSVRSDWRKVIKSMNQGQPLAAVARRSGLRRDLQKLALRVDTGT